MVLKTSPKNHIFPLRTLLSLFIVAGLLISARPVDSVKAEVDFSQYQKQHSPARMDPSLETSKNPDLSRTTLVKPEYDYEMLNKGIEVGEDGMLPLPSTVGGRSLPAGTDGRSLETGITIDLTYDVVMGKLPGRAFESVTVTMGEGYGAAVVDDTGFFWTPVWNTNDGYPMDLVCDTTVSVVVGSDPAKDITPPCLTGGIDIQTETIHGSISGDTGSTEVLFYPGFFNPELDAMQRLNPQPSIGLPYMSTDTQGDGSFDFDYGAPFKGNLGAENLFEVNYQVGEEWARTYLYPDEPVFMVQQYSIIAGYAAVDQAVTATVYEGTGPGERWSGETDAYGPHGFYTFAEVPIEVGDVVEVTLEGGATLDTTVVELGNLVFDAAEDTLTGSAPEGAVVRASFWDILEDSSEGYFLYRNHDVSAAGGDIFSIDFSTVLVSPIDLEAYDDVLVVVEDSDGNQVQVLSGPPFVSATISLDSNLDCAYGRLNGPDLPIVVQLDKGGGDITTRETGDLTDVGNRLNGCYLVPDSDNPLEFNPGDIITLKDGTSGGWEGSVEVVDFTQWSGNTASNSLSGMTTGAGDVETRMTQWHGELYPSNGSISFKEPVSSGSFSPDYHADLRDGVLFSFTHTDPLTGFATETNPFSYQPTLPYFELVLPIGISGMVGSPGETVTARLYDGATLLAETSEDKDNDPYRYYLDELDGHVLQDGYRVEVSTSGGWAGEMIVPDLSIDRILDTDTLTAIGPDGLLYLEVNNNNPEDEQYIGQFVPASPAKWDLARWNWDLLPSDWISVTYQAVDGNRAYYGVSMHELSEVSLWLDDGARDWMEGMAQPGSTVTAERDAEPLFTATADPGGSWDSGGYLDLHPGDLITVSSGAGDYPIDVEIPDPLTAEIDAETNLVSGQIGGWLEKQLEVHANWEDGYRDLETDSSGNYSTVSDPYSYIPWGGNGYIQFSEMVDYSKVTIHQNFWDPNLVMDVNYAYDWIEGGYLPGHDVTLTVTESDGETLKGSAEMTTGEIPGWDGQTGFSTSYADPWIGDQPDFQSGDWVFGAVNNEGMVYTNAVRLGTITGEVDVELETIRGTVAASWLPQDEAVHVRCQPDVEGIEVKEDWVLPDGEDEYACSWDPATEWDVSPNQEIGVSYHDPGGYDDPVGNPVLGDNWVHSGFIGYSQELILRIHYDNDWIEGNYISGHDVLLVVYDSEGIEKARTTVPTGPIDDWGGQSGFATHLEGVTWDPEDPDIQPGDVVHGEVDDGAAFTANVKIGLITGDTDVPADSVTGTVSADWLLGPPYNVDEVDVGCHVDEPDGEEVFTSVIPDGEDTYNCVFDGDNTYDIITSSDVMVSYFEPDGHQIYGYFPPPSPYLVIEKSFTGESPGFGGNAAFTIRYQNRGELPADDVTIVDTMVGMTYLSDTSDVTPSVDPGNQEVTWNLGTVAPSDDWVSFYIYTDITGDEGDPLSNTVVISASSFDRGDPSEKTSTWEGTVAANDTHLEVGKQTWTENPAPGEDFVYEIDVCNTGSTSSSTVTLTDTLPALTEYVSWWSEDPGWEITHQVGQILELEHSQISSSDCSQVYVRVMLDADAFTGDLLVNEVEIAADNDIETDDNTAAYEHQVGDPFTDLAVYQSFSRGSLTPGGQYCFDVNFNNLGNLPVSGPIVVTVTLPDDTSFAGWDSQGVVNIDKVEEIGSQVTWHLADSGEMIAGVQGAIEVCVDIIQDAAPDTVLEHLAEIAIQPGETDINNNTGALTEMVYPHGPNLRVHKLGEWQGTDMDPYAWYELRVENIGDQTVTDVVVMDTYPAGMSLGDDPSSSWEDVDFTSTEDSFTYTIESWEPGWSFNVQFTLNPDSPDPGAIYTNTATVMPDGNDIHPDDNLATSTLFTGPDMWVEKSHVIGEFLPGEEITYLLRFGNAQTADWGEMEGNAVLTDLLPEGMSYVSAELHWCETGEWCAVDPEINGQELIWELYPLGPDNWNEMTLSVVLDSEIEDSNPLINQASITSKESATDADPFLENNTSEFVPELVDEGFYIYIPLISR